MEKKEVIKKLKIEYENDFAVLLNSVVSGFHYWVYGDKQTAEKELKRITANCELLKPCTVELINIGVV